MQGTARARWRAAAAGAAACVVLAAGMPPAAAGAGHVPGSVRLPGWSATDSGGEPLDIDVVQPIDTVLQIRLAAAAAGPAEALAVLSVHVSLQDAGAAGIPVSVLTAYRQAEANLAGAMPSCHLPWWLIAGIGRIESGHAQGGRVDPAGTTRGRILGPVLDGSLAGTAVIRDTDGGAMDGDPVYDRAVGPMQFLPGTWRAYARDGNGDGVVNPHNVFDATTTAGVYLCRNGGDLAVPANIAAAVLRYNHSDSYLRAVLTWGAAYRDNVTPAADQGGSIPTDAPPRQPETPAPITPASPAPATPPADQTPSPTPPAPSPSSGPTPSPLSTPEPTPTPSPPPTPQPSPSPSSPPSPATSASGGLSAPTTTTAETTGT